MRILPLNGDNECVGRAYFSNDGGTPARYVAVPLPSTGRWLVEYVTLAQQGGSATAPVIRIARPYAVTADVTPAIVASDPHAVVANGTGAVMAGFSGFCVLPYRGLVTTNGVPSGDILFDVRDATEQTIRIYGLGLVTVSAAYLLTWHFRRVAILADLPSLTAGTVV